jgi:AcrR family transcriptional regulator
MLDPSERPLSRQEQILAAALRTFGRYGYRRTSMELIAQAADVSRPALYQHFRGKEDVFRAMTAELVEELVGAAQAARAAGGPVGERLHAVLSVKTGFLTGTVDAAFRSEVVADAERVAGDLLESFKSRLAGVITALLRSAADELDLVDRDISADDVAALLLDAVVGIAQEDAGPEVLDKRLRDLVHLTLRGLTGR